jgi:L-seryl-tRNA(Ser) seleniumtransferase
VCAAVTARVPRASVDTIATTATTGGGTLPDARIPSAGVAVRAHDGAERLAARLRHSRPPVVGRIEDDRVIIDLRTVSEAELDPLASGIVNALAGTD